MATSQLQNLIKSYANKALCAKDVNPVLESFTDLRPAKKTFVFNNGGTKELVCLEGTIPITYKGTVYRIPIAMWLQETHPKDAPMVYVTPTATMNIRAGQHVDSNGHVSVPYLNDWRYPTSDSAGLLQLLSMIFSEKPPVFSKPSRPPPPRTGGPTPAASPYPNPASTAGANPPYPTGGTSGMPTPSRPYYPPQTTPYPPAQPAPGSNYPTPYPPQQSTGGYGGAGGSTYGASYPSGYGQGSAYMSGNPYPPAAGTTPYPPAQPYPPQGPQPQLNYPSGPTPGPPAATASMYQSGAGGSMYPPQTASGAAPGYPSATASTAGVAMQPFGSHTQENAENVSSIDDSQLKTSLITAVQEKAKRNLRDVVHVTQDEMSALQDQQKELKRGQEELMDMEKKMAEEQAELETAKVTLVSAKDDLTDKLSKIAIKDEMDPEDAIDTTTPLYKQLLTNFAEEQAVEDTMYCLGEALTKEVVDLDTYLKKTRELSRMQFMQKALIEKCRSKAGLAPV